MNNPTPLTSPISWYLPCSSFNLAWMKLPEIGEKTDNTMPTNFEGVLLQILFFYDFYDCLANDATYVVAAESVEVFHPISESICYLGGSDNRSHRMSIANGFSHSYYIRHKSFILMIKGPEAVSTSTKSDLHVYVHSYHWTSYLDFVWNTHCTPISSILERYQCLNFAPKAITLLKVPLRGYDLTTAAHDWFNNKSTNAL